MSSSLARLLAMSQGASMGGNPLAQMIALQQGMQPQQRSAPQNPIPSQAPQPMPRPQVRSGVPGLLSRFGGSVLNTLAPDPGEQVTSLIGKDAIKAAQSQALLSLGASLLSNSGWQQRPVSLGEALGKGLQASQASYGQAISGAAQNAVTVENARSLQEQRAAQAESNRSLAQQRATQEIERQAIIRARPGYAKYSTGWEGLTPEQAVARYRQWESEAASAGDFDVAKMASNNITNILQNQPKDAQPKYSYENYRGETKVYRDGQLVRTDGRRDPVGAGGGEGTPEGIAVSDRPAYNALEKKAATIADHTASYGSLQSALADPAVASNPTEQYNLLFQFVKSRDNSVVRASELTLLNSANPTDQRIGLWLQNKFTGQTMTLPMLRRIVEIMGREVGSQRAGLAADPRLGRLKRQGYALPEIEAVANPAPTAAKPTVKASDAAKRLGLTP